MLENDWNSGRLEFRNVMVDIELRFPKDFRYAFQFLQRIDSAAYNFCAVHRRASERSATVQCELLQFPVEIPYEVLTNEYLQVLTSRHASFLRTHPAPEAFL